MVTLEFSAPSLRSLRLGGECIERLFTAETQRSQRQRREKLKLGRYFPVVNAGRRAEVAL
jgi:hypothetical protein